jgi:Fe2+ transport system protein FeoA
MAGLLTCPLCGFAFERADALCRHGCPLGATCGLARCPVCEYEFPERRPRGVWLRRLLGRGAAAPAGDEGLRTARDLLPGERANVLCLAGDSPSRRNNLAVFGLVPGAEIVLVQRLPSLVVRIGETVLALEAEVAADIVVGPALPEPAAAPVTLETAR